MIKAKARKRRFWSTNYLTIRWGMSRSGVLGVLNRAKVRSFYFGGVKRGTRRFLEEDIIAFEDRVQAK